ncbi:uncharacterized protein BO97DRAFT_340573, partial [Aspergillus homomorphus CBS 101889]
DKSLTSDLDPILKLQGIPWLLRKTILFTPLTIEITHTITTSTPKTPDTNPTQTIHFSAQSHTALKTAAANPPSDIRHFDGRFYTQRNFLFGRIECRNRYIVGSVSGEGCAAKGNGVGVRPNVELQSTGLSEGDAGIAIRFLRGQVEVDGVTPSPGFLVEGPVVLDVRLFEHGEGEGQGLWVHVFDRREGGGWSSEQIWGFEMIGGVRLYTRRAVVTDGKGVFKLARLVYRLVES